MIIICVLIIKNWILKNSYMVTFNCAIFCQFTVSHGKLLGFSDVFRFGKHDIMMNISLITKILVWKTNTIRTVIDNTQR